MLKKKKTASIILVISVYKRAQAVCGQNTKILHFTQFGSRIARESNRKNFGSNRAANQASAGSVQINHHMQ
jgi:hypothetical protein